MLRATQGATNQLPPCAVLLIPAGVQVHAHQPAQHGQSDSQGRSARGIRAGGAGKNEGDRAPDDTKAKKLLAGNAFTGGATFAGEAFMQVVLSLHNHNTGQKLTLEEMKKRGKVLHSEVALAAALVRCKPA